MWPVVRVEENALQNDIIPQTHPYYIQFHICVPFHASANTAFTNFATRPPTPRAKFI